MKKNIMLPVAATFIAAVSLPTVLAQPDALRQSELLFSYANMSDESAYVAIRGVVSSDEYVAINDVGWVAPKASGNVTNDSPWITEQQINKNSFVSLAFLTRNNEVITCKEDFYLDDPIKITLNRGANGQLECTATDQSTPAPSPSAPGLNFRFKELSSYNLSRYALFFFDPAEQKWKNATRSINIHDEDQQNQAEHGWDAEVVGIKPSYYSPAFTDDSIVQFAVREEYNGQDEDYNKDLPMWICGEVKFSGSYDFIFYEEGQNATFSGCSVNMR
ncbi:MAG: hypothetical protein ACRC9R_08570 [Enterovibrio sp.]